MSKYTGCIILLLIPLIAMYSCGRGYLTQEVEASLRLAEENRTELEKVLSHYSTDENDSLKLKAARFLIANMKYYNTATGKGVDEFNRFIDQAFSYTAESYLEEYFYDPFRDTARYLNLKPTPVSDLKAMTADYLIRNIDQAFDVWQKPFACHLNFDDFAELILPYRIGNEELESWRDLFTARFGSLLSDTVVTAIDGCRIINDSLIGYNIHTFESSVSPSSIRPSSLIDIKFGLCDDYASLAVYAMRALGIPVAKELIPRFGTRPNTHSFNMVRNNDGATHDFSGAENNPDEHLSRFEAIPKIYRKSFGLQQSSLAMNCGDEEIPRQLASPFLKDVTHEHRLIGACDIEVDFDSPQSRIAYLAVFDINGWYPVGWGLVKNKKVIFKAVGPAIVYSAACYQNGELHAVGYPFLVEKGGAVLPLKADCEALDTMTVRRKYPIATGLKPIPPSIVGGRFEGANKKDFSDARLLHRIAEAPAFEYITVESLCDDKFKYVRYISSDSSRVNMAEIEFYDRSSDTVVCGKPFGTREKSPYYPHSEVEHVFDRNPLTFLFTANPNGWAGMALAQPTSIKKIRYLIRNGDNGIRKGQQYELFYAENGEWRSIGSQIARQDNNMTFTAVPQRGLYWLRNRSKGKEERVFRFVDGEQVWY